MFRKRNEEEIHRKILRRGMGPPPVFLGSILFLSSSAAGQDPRALLAPRGAGQVRLAEVALSLRVTTTKPGQPPSTGMFAVEAKGRDRSRIRFLNPAEPGSPSSRWATTCGSSCRTRRTRSASRRATVSRAGSRRPTCPGRTSRRTSTQSWSGKTCWTEKLRRPPPHGESGEERVVSRGARVDRRGGGLYRKAVFLVSSGKTARETTFDEYRPYHGVLSLAKMTIVDTLRPGTTVVEYLNYEKKTLPDATFEVRPAAQ